MDKEALITAVFEKPPIWDKREKLHSNRNVIDKYWKEISNQMNESEVKVRKQWKYLRDQFSVELGKYPPPRSGDAAEDMPASKWPYFSQLLFLKDIVKPRTATENLSSTQSTRDIQMTDQEDSQSVEGNENSDNEDAFQTSEHEQEKPIETTPTLSKTTSIPTKKRRGTTQTFQASILEIERRKVDYLENKTKRSSSDNQDDEHLSFFKSLLPHVRKILEKEYYLFVVAYKN
ncbi:hypothetical protein FQR65_LT13780 [Abscondita terminalis]|nr:hypothetical protein FQR65_LT13780 [Abscondita terminalis]